MTELGAEPGEPDTPDSYPDYPPRLYRAKALGRYRQGDLCLAYFHQLRTPNDAPGPGAEDVTGRNLPFFGEATDHPFKLEKRNLELRVWTGWVMILNQGCDLERLDDNDSRLIIAPVVFKTKWPGDVRWSQIRDGAAPGYMFLPAMREADRNRTGSPKGWPQGVEAAAVLSSTTTIGRRVAGEPAFGLSSEMQHLLQQRLVSFFSVRDWKAAKQRKEILGKQILEISETDERTDGPAKLYKIHLADPGADTGDDEITVGVLFQR